MTPHDSASRWSGPETLQVEVGEGLCGVTAAEWECFFPGHPDTFENVTLSQRCGMDGIDFRTVVVRDGRGAALVVPTFEARFRASSMTDGTIRGVLRALEPIVPGWLRPRLLGVGLVEGEWGAVGVRPGLGADR